MSDFTRILRPGTIRDYNGRRIDVFVKIEFTDGKLSITGVEGPKANGDARGSCGQIDGHYRHRDPADDDRRYGDALIGPEDIDFAPGWDEATWLDFLDAWERWHLNDLRSECEHQRAFGWHTEAKREVKIFNWQLSRAMSNKRTEIKRDAERRLALGERVGLTKEEQRIVNLPYWVSTVEGQPEPAMGVYEPRREGAVETKALGWLRPNEHPGGILMKPCPTCGFKYGSAWLDETVPDTVIAFLQSLPEADKQPAWV